MIAHAPVFGFLTLRPDPTSLPTPRADPTRGGGGLTLRADPTCYVALGRDQHGQFRAVAVECSFRSREEAMARCV
jgi:hypothetical protein